ncbi:LuxR C-terminal-related transcriptional regulator [Streptomyces sp. NPDC088124]|uniref:LuxR C-terminal-related transcriptional regulator n=1 Tax=Streptomyces sp. NPDC088124 TaxID=3154654 RepID=UPI003429A468
MTGRWLVSGVLRDYDLVILSGLARGQSVPEIAAAAGVSAGTLRNRVLVLRQRMGALSCAHAVALAYEHGWLNGLTREPAEPVRLSGHQRRVLRMVAAGLTNQQISRRLGVSTGMAVMQVRRIYRVMGTARTGRSAGATRAHTVALAYQHGHLTLTDRST